MNPLDAAFHVVHDYDGGAVALAPRLGKSSTQLSHEVRPPSGNGAKFGLVDAVKVSALTNDHRILHSFAEQLNYRCVRLDQLAHIADEDLLHAVNRFAKETGEALAAMSSVLEDGRITENEIRKFEKQVADIAPAAIALAERMRAIAAEQSKVRALRQVEHAA